MIPLDDPGRLALLNLRDFFAALSFSSGVLGEDERGDESSHASGGADKLLLRRPLKDFFRETGVRGCDAACSGIGSRTNSGRDSIARESFICIWS